MLLKEGREQPIWKHLEGAVQPQVRIYNTCGGPGYDATANNSDATNENNPGWPGYGDEGSLGPLQVNWASIHAAGNLAVVLVSEGVTGMKVWPFVRYAHRHGGHYLSTAEIEEGMHPLREIRGRAGDNIEIMIEGHAFFHLSTALQLARKLMRTVRYQVIGVTISMAA